MLERKINLGHTNTLDRDFLESRSYRHGWEALGSGENDGHVWIVWESPIGIRLEEIFDRVGDFIPRMLRLVDGRDLEEIAAKLKS